MGRDYDGIEHYQAGYLMAECNIGEYLTVLPGVRWERDYSLYHGQSYRAVTIGGNRQSPPLDLTPLSAEREHDFWLPMVHLTVKPFDWLKIRLARTQTLTRPDYRQYAPITYITAMQDQIVAANSSLKPAQSTNYDAAISVFDNAVGLFTVSGFHKKIKDLIFSTEYDFAPGIPAPPGSNIPDSWLAANAPIYSYAMNNPYPATVKGFELEWQTHFWYLPSVLQGLVLSVNYTRIYSEVEIHQYFTNRVQVRPVPPVFRYVLIDSSRTSRVPDQPAEIANVTLGYDYEGFSARLSYLFQTDRVAGIGRNSSLDSFTGEYARWDLTLQQKLYWGLQIYANLTNLNSRPDKSFRNFLLTNPTYIEYYGFAVDFGVRFRL
jgi:TonB-dependent receptor